MWSWLVGKKRKDELIAEFTQAIDEYCEGGDDENLKLKIASIFMVSPFKLRVELLLITRNMIGRSPASRPSIQKLSDNLERMDLQGNVRALLWLEIFHCVKKHKTKE